MLNQHPAVKAVGRRRHARRGARRRGAGLRRAARRGRRVGRSAGSRPASSSMRWRNSPTTRRRATSPSSTRCRSRLRRRSSAGSCANSRSALAGPAACIDTRAHEEKAGMRMKRGMTAADAGPTKAWPWRCRSRCPTCATRRAARTGSSARRSRRCCATAASRRTRSTACASAASRWRPTRRSGVTQHLGLSPRWLDHVPTGGASGVMCLRRAARAVQAGDADVVACVGADTNHVDSFRQTLGSFSNFARDATYPYGSGGPNSIFAFITAQLHAHLRRDARRLRPHLRSTSAATRSTTRTRCSRSRSRSTSTSRARPIADPIHLFDCVMPCAGAEAFLVMSEEQRARPRPAACGGARRDRAAQRLSPKIR